MLPRGFREGREGYSEGRPENGIVTCKKPRKLFLMDLSKCGKILCICYFQGFIFFEAVSTALLEFGNFYPYKSEQVIVPDDVW